MQLLLLAMKNEFQHVVDSVSTKTMSDIAKFRNFAQDALVELLKQLITLLTARARGRELIVVVRDLLRVLTLSKRELLVPPTVTQDLYEIRMFLVWKQY
jgi:hypothetical protein